MWFETATLNQIRPRASKRSVCGYSPSSSAWISHCFVFGSKPAIWLPNASVTQTHGGEPGNS